MIWFVAALLGLTILAILIQLITKMKIIGGNELGVVSGGGGTRGFRSLSGGRAFIIPILNRFSVLDLTPYTIEVRVESAIAAGVVPLNVKATVSFAIASNEAGRMRAATRILKLAKDPEELRTTASDIIEGHLRDSIASITPEQVMKDKDTLVAKMINVCKSDLENIGLEITTMNIADVDDHRLEGVDEPDLYIALLKRVQTANAETKARQARAEATAAAVEESETRRAEVEVRELENELENLIAETRVMVAQQNQRRVVGVEKAQRDATAKVEGLKREIAAETEGIEMLRKKFEASVITPALAEKDRSILAAKADAARIRGKAQGEINQLRETLAILGSSGPSGSDAYLLENFERLIGPFAETLQFFPVEKLSVITGAEGQRRPISAIHPDAIALEKNNLLGDVMSDVLRGANADRSIGSRNNAADRSAGTGITEREVPASPEPPADTSEDEEQKE
jgi:flotillin